MEPIMANNETVTLKLSIYTVTLIDGLPNPLGKTRSALLRGWIEERLEVEYNQPDKRIRTRPIRIDLKK